MDKDVELDLPDVLANSRGLALCLHNLINNAVKYANGIPLMTIKAALRRDERGQEVCIAVRDRGPGIEGSELEHIFHPFYRGRSARTGQIHGTGLGLSLARSTAERMGGNLTVKSTPGAGSEFTLHLPVASTQKNGRSLTKDSTYSSSNRNLQEDETKDGKQNLAGRR